MNHSEDKEQMVAKEYPEGPDSPNANLKFSKNYAYDQKAPSKPESADRQDFEEDSHSGWDAAPEPGPDIKPDTGFRRPDTSYIPDEPKSSGSGIFYGIMGGILVALVLVIGILLGRIFSGSEKTKKEASTTAGQEQETQVPAAASETEAPPAATALSDKPVSSLPSAVSDNYGDYTFELNNVVYQLPCYYSDFVANGWSLYSDRNQKETDEISGTSYDTYYLTDGVHKISVTLYNPGKDVCTLSDTMVGGISIYKKDEVSFSIAKGITPSSSTDEIKKAFGTPHYDNAKDDYESIDYTYESDNRNRTSFFIYPTGSMRDYSSISLLNMVFSPDDAIEVSDQVPAYLATYRAPASMPDDSTATVFRLDGKLYQLPCPLSEFTDDGWSVSDVNKASVSGMNHESNVLTLKKGDITISLGMINYEKKAIKTENCAVYSLLLSNTKASYSAGFPDGFFEMAGGIRLDMSLDAIKKATSSGTWNPYKNDSDTYKSYSASYYSKDNNVSISYHWMEFKDSDDHYIRSCTVSNSDWTY